MRQSETSQVVQQCERGSGRVNHSSSRCGHHVIRLASTYVPAEWYNRPQSKCMEVDNGNCCLPEDS